MTATAPVRPGRSGADHAPLAALGLAEARRYARHPLFLAGFGVLLASLVAGITQQAVVDVGAVEGTVAPAFLLGVFGFVVAHRLTTSMDRNGDVVLITPARERRRTAALLLACLVPMTACLVLVAAVVALSAAWPPHSNPPGDSVAWFGFEPAVDMVAVLVSTTVLAALGGPLLGVAAGRWAPFRGAALVGMVVLCFGVAFAEGLPGPWDALAPWVNFNESVVVDGRMRSSWLRTDITPLWSCLYTALLCVLAALAALLHDPRGRRPLLLTGAAVTAAAVGCWLMAWWTA